MASRMEKYYTNINSTKKRSQRNKELYRDIYDYGEYSNIEGIATMEKENEVDITKIKNMLKNRENYKKQKQYRQITSGSKDTYLDELEEDTISQDFIKEKEEKIYDIRDVLSKAKDKKPEEDTPRSLDNTNYNILKNLKLDGNNKKDYEEEELKNLIDTIANTSALNQLTDKELSLNMLDLEETKHTSIDDNSIKKILEQAKKTEEKKKNEQPVIDNSFYTSSLNFSKEDFEEANQIVSKKRRFKFIFKFFLFIFLIAITGAIIFGVYYLIK